MPVEIARDLVASLPPLRLGVTGTDTGIGKTVVSCALVARARALGLRVAPLKPVESGYDEHVFDDGSPLPSDAERLRAANGNEDRIELMRPYALAEPLAPIVAARRAGVAIELRVLDEAARTLGSGRDVLLVEGAGGLLVPINREVDYLDLFRRWDCEAVVISGNRIGVINHTLLTVRAAQHASVRVRAVVLTALTDRDPTLAEATNYDILREYLPAEVSLHRMPWVDRWHDAEALAAAAEATGLDTILTRPPL